ncbi:hypothetical protein BGZ74_002136, partial [Mortierella antarctica]
MPSDRPLPEDEEEQKEEATKKEEEDARKKEEGLKKQDQVPDPKWDTEDVPKLKEKESIETKKLLTTEEKVALKNQFEPKKESLRSRHSQAKKDIDAKDWAAYKAQRAIMQMAFADGASTTKVLEPSSTDNSESREEQEGATDTTSTPVFAQILDPTHMLEHLEMIIKHGYMKKEEKSAEDDQTKRLEQGPSLATDSKDQESSSSSLEPPQWSSRSSTIASSEAAKSKKQILSNQPWMMGHDYSMYIRGGPRGHGGHDKGKDDDDSDDSTSDDEDPDEEDPEETKGKAEGNKKGNDKKQHPPNSHPSCKELDELLAFAMNQMKSETKSLGGQKGSGENNESSNLWNKPREPFKTPSQPVPPKWPIKLSDATDLSSLAGPVNKKKKNKDTHGKDKETPFDSDDNTDSVSGTSEWQHSISQRRSSISSLGTQLHSSLRNTSLSGSSSGKPPPISLDSLEGTGMDNSNSTSCYVNSVVQALRSIPSCCKVMEDAFKGIHATAQPSSNKDRDRWLFIKRIQMVVERLEANELRKPTSSQSAACSSDITAIVEQFNTIFPVRGQQDVSEFITFLQDCFDKVLQQSNVGLAPNQSSLSDLFNMSFDMNQTCSNCEHAVKENTDQAGHILVQLNGGGPHDIKAGLVKTFIEDELPTDISWKQLLLDATILYMWCLFTKVQQFTEGITLLLSDASHQQEIL